MVVVVANVTEAFVKFFLAHLGYKLADGRRAGYLLRRGDTREQDDEMNVKRTTAQKQKEECTEDMILSGIFPRKGSWSSLFFNGNNYFSAGKTSSKQMAHTPGAHSGKSMDPRAASISTLK